MSTPETLPPPPNPRMLPVLATVTFGAAVIAAWGFTSLALGVDVISQKDAGPLLGPLMVLAACLVTFAALRRATERSTPAVHALAAAASVYISMLLIGAVVYATGRGDLSWIVLFIGGYALSAFVIVPALLAGLTVVAVWALSRPR